jgi:hypothetical protein
LEGESCSSRKFLSYSGSCGRWLRAPKIPRSATTRAGGIVGNAWSARCGRLTAHVTLNVRPAHVLGALSIGVLELLRGRLLVELTKMLLLAPCGALAHALLELLPLALRLLILLVQVLVAGLRLLGR